MVYEIKTTNQDKVEKVKAAASRLDKASHLMESYLAALREQEYQVVEAEYDDDGCLMRFIVESGETVLTFELVERVARQGLIFNERERIALMRDLVGDYSDFSDDDETRRIRVVRVE